MTSETEFHYPAWAISVLSTRHKHESFQACSFHPMATSGAMPSRTTTKKKPPAPPRRAAEGSLGGGAHGVPRGPAEERAAEAQAKYQADLDMSWIAHDSALEGVVYTLAELRSAMGARRRRSGVRLEPAARRRGDPPPPRGAQLRPRAGDEAARADHGRRGQAHLLRAPSRGGRRKDRQVPQGHPPASPLLPRVRAARQDRLQAPADHRLGERSRDAADAGRPSASPRAPTTTSSAFSPSRPTAARSRGS